MPCWLIVLHFGFVIFRAYWLSDFLCLAFAKKKQLAAMLPV